LSTCGIYFRCFFWHAHSRHRAFEPHILHQSTLFGPRMCLLGVSSIFLTSYGSYPSKYPLIFGTRLWISSLTVFACISAKKKRVITLDSSKCTSHQDSMCSQKKEWDYFGGHIDLKKFVSTGKPCKTDEIFQRPPMQNRCRKIDW
jgi:hypothetical protein